MSRAVEASDYPFVKFLLEQGADPKFRDITGKCAYDFIDDDLCSKNGASELDVPKNPDGNP